MSSEPAARSLLPRRTLPANPEGEDDCDDVLRCGYLRSRPAQRVLSSACARLFCSASALSCMPGRSEL